jgi:hypothetical protein
MRFDGFLLGRQVGADGVVDEVEQQPAAFAAVARRIEPAHGLDRFFEDAAAALCVSLRCAVVGK